MKSSVFLTVLATVLLSGEAQAYPDPINFSGEFVFRTEQMKEEQGTTAPIYTSDRLRNRLRLRLRGDVKVNDSAAVSFRFSTGSTAAVGTISRYNDLGTYSTGQTIMLDLAMLKYTASEMVTLFAGKMTNPFYLINDQIFSPAVTPDGVALKYSQKFDATEVSFNSGLVWLLEQYDTTEAGVKDNDVQIVGNQVAANYKAASWNAMIVVSSYLFNGVQGSAAPSSASGGNTYTGANFTYGYNLTAIGLEVGTTVSEMPLTVFAESSTNGAEGVSNNKTATTFGIKLNKLKEKGTWTLLLDTRDVQKDAVLGALSDGDTGSYGNGTVNGGASNLTMLRARFGYQLADNMNVMFSYYDGKKNTATVATAAGSAEFASVAVKSNKMMLDFNITF